MSPIGHLYLSMGTLRAYWNAFLDLLSIFPNGVPSVTCVGRRFFQIATFCNCHDGLCSCRGGRSRRVLLLIRSGHIQLFCKDSRSHCIAHGWHALCFYAQVNLYKKQ